MMKNEPNPGRTALRTAVLITGLLLCAVVVAPVFAADVPQNPLTDTKHIWLTMLDGGMKYLKFDGGGVNALHMTTSTAEPYGQVTTTETDSGTFFISDTGGRGFFDDTILMVAVKNRDDGTLPDDLRITVSAGGYQWEPMPELNQPPTMDVINHVPESASATLTASDFLYGPQSWKPAGNNLPFNYPIYYGQNVAAGEDFSILFVDLNAGAIGLNSFLPDLTDEGMVRVRYSIEGCDSMVSFSVYGWCNQSNQGEGISWTNRLSGTGSSGYVVAGSSGGGAGGDSPAGGGSTGSGDSSDAVPGGASYIPPAAPANWESSFGTLNITSSPGGAAIFIDGAPTGATTNTTIDTLPSGMYIVRIEQEGYEAPDDAVVTIRNNATKNLHFTLTPKEGIIYVYSEPVGAVVWVDGVKTPVRTNGVVRGIPGGNHTVRMAYGDALPVERNVTVSDAEPATVYISFISGDDATGGMSGNALPVTTTSAGTNPVPYEDGIAAQDMAGEGTTGGHGTGPLDWLWSWLHRLFGDAASPAEAGAQEGDGRGAGLAAAAPEPAPASESMAPMTGDQDPATVLPETGAEVSLLPGGVFVSSLPGGATVRVDGLEEKADTPCIIAGLKPGPHQVVVIGGAGTRTMVSRTVWVYPGAVTPADFDFVSTVYTATMAGDPDRGYEGLPMTVDGAYPELSTSTAVTVKQSGSFVTFREGENLYSCIVSTLGDMSHEVEWKRRSLATIEVVSDPAGAMVFVDGYPMAERTPCTIATISEGRHYVVVAKEGYEPEGREITVADTVQECDLTVPFLLAQYTAGSLGVTSDQPGASIFLNGRYTGLSTPATFLDLPIGTYEVGCSYNGTAAGSRSVTVIPSALTSCEIALKAISS